MGSNEGIPDSVLLFLFIKGAILISNSSFNSNLSLLNIVRCPNAVFLSPVIIATPE